MKEARKVAIRIASRAPIAVGRANTAIHKSMRTNLGTGLACEVQAVLLTFSSDDKEEGMATFMERREPELKGK